MKDLSIIIPVYNSANILKILITEIIVVINKKLPQITYEIILVNDGSTDNSWDEILLLSRFSNLIKGINFSSNFGQHNAIMAALNECTGNVAITMDDDYQHDPKSIVNIFNLVNSSFDVCYVNYIDRKHEKWKIFFSKLSNVISSFFLNKPLNIYCSSFKGFKKKIINEIITYKKRHVYIDGLILKSTRNITMISVLHQNRLNGESNYNFLNLINLWSNMMINLPNKPLKLSTILGYFFKYVILIFKIKNYNKKQYIILNKTY